MDTSSALARVVLVKTPGSVSAPPLAKTQPRPQASPFIKWAGGKGRLLSQLEPLLPQDFLRRRYLEPFLGGGALFFARHPRRALLADINPTLIETYKAVRDQVEDILSWLHRLAKAHCKEAYYAARTRYNSERLTHAERAAMFIYLNKTCFNGLHRVNRKGKFNVPMGRYKNPRIADEEGLRRASQALRRANILCDSFEGLVDRARPNDFIYFDPPYAPVSETANFTGYASDGFTSEDQRRLRNVYAELDQRGCKLMLSNSDVPFIRELYSRWTIHTVQASRAINSKASRRGKVNEVVVCNYRS